MKVHRTWQADSLHRQYPTSHFAQITEPTRIQRMAIPELLGSRSVILSSETGT
jgi:superfamily II DNA/RNA helicase